MANKDPLIIEVEEWLNENYTHHPQFDYVKPTGRPGNTVVGRLIMALQIELGITNPVPTFGPSTARKFQPLSRDQFDEEVRSNLVYILQGAFWAKGYSPGTFDGKFNSRTENAIHRFQSDVGFKNTTGIVDAKLMNALLNTDGFRLARSGRPDYRIIQQVLNTEYADGYFEYIPTNGVYERKTNKALIYALQIESGLGAVANGNYGPSTIANTPTLRPGDSRYGLNRILKFGLAVNGAHGLVLNGDYDSETEREVREFQDFMTLPNTGIADMPTIKQLLTSNGYTGRAAIACDASMIIDSATAATLKRYNYEVIGRYLTGNVGYPNSRPKGMTHEELAILEEKGIRVFPIYQDGGTTARYFTKEQGKKDAREAIQTAYRLGFPAETIIYFAVDFDAYDYQVSENIIPYMTSVRKVFEMNKNSLNMPNYEVGIYGPRNICIRCLQHNDIRTKSSFVSNMSTGFSGNLGFPMPENWAFGQFLETSIGLGNGYLEIDKNDYSGRDTGTSSINPVFENRNENEQVLFEKWKDIIPTIPVLDTDPWLLSSGFKFDERYTIVNNGLLSLDIETSVEYTTPTQGSNLRIDVLNGEIQGNIETIFNEELGYLVSSAVGDIKNVIEKASVSIDNGFIELGFEINKNEINFSMSIYNKDIEIPDGTVNLGVSIILIIKLPFPDFSEAQVEELTNLVQLAGFVLAALLIGQFITSATLASSVGYVFT
ncbi:MAG: DUF1906 domain-containing protein, partial [Atopostipes sp.]|nr:DUF1906 domain-containing protein [Atopostipes sp.]